MGFFDWLFKRNKKEKELHIPTSTEWQKEWQDFLVDKLSGSSLETFLAASDIDKIYPNILSLDSDKQVRILAEFFKWLAYYESSWNPKSQCVDVGIKENRNTWSIGLLQLSVIDQSSLGIRLGFTFDDLLIAEKNFTLGIEIMKNQIRKRGKIFIPRLEKGNPGLYWATLCPGGHFDKSREITSFVQMSLQSEAF